MKQILAVLLVMIFSFSASAVFADTASLLVLDNETRVALRAAEQAVEAMPGIYSWEEFRSCSSFVSAYLKQLSFPVDGQGGYKNFPDPFPWSGTILQVDWMRRNASSYVKDAPLIDFLEGKLWSEIEPGDLVYLQTAIGHNGYNTYYHVVVLVGYHEDGSPQFAEISTGNYASSNRSFEQMTSFYKKDANGNWLIKPFQTTLAEEDELIVTWFDTLSFVERLWTKTGKVYPNSSELDSFSTVLTVNLVDGTTTVFEKSVDSGFWTPVVFGSRDELFGTIGEKLPTNEAVGSAFFEKRMPGVYSSDSGVFVSKSGVYQNTWTSQILAEMTSFENAGFCLEKDKSFGLSYWGWYYLQYFGETEDESCIKYDSHDWNKLQNYLDGKSGVAVVFSYPDFDQNLLTGFDFISSPFYKENYPDWFAK